MTQSKKPVALAIGATLAGGLMLSGSAFASTPLAQGYLLGAQQAAAADKAKEGSCGAGMKTGMQGKSGEGKCGMAAMDTDKDGKVSRAEFTAAHKDKAAEFDTIDSNKDGSIDATEMKAHHASMHADKKAGDGTEAADKKAGKKAGMEGKCGEGKCGSM